MHFLYPINRSNFIGEKKVHGQDLRKIMRSVIKNSSFVSITIESKMKNEPEESVGMIIAPKLR
jgi:hypothetical protein